MVYLLMSLGKWRMAMRVRLEEQQDFDAIRRVNFAAFGRQDEGRLVDALRTSGAIICSLVAEEEGQIVGHVLFSPVTLYTDSDQLEGAGLGPVAVLPAFQRQGVGEALIRAGLADCRDAGFGFAVVLGHPSYYPRFGFRPSRPLGIRWEHNAPEEAFMVMELRPGALSGLSGTVRYQPEFADV
jgi:putative acetyltransferase